LTDERIPLVVWQTCAFTIHASVWQGLDGGKKSIVDIATMYKYHKTVFVIRHRRCCCKARVFVPNKFFRMSNVCG
jgi:hypothetical protein